MIKFNCRCSHTFVVEDDQAGASIQCPACGLLVDVPTLSDAANLSADGTYTLSEDPIRAERDRLNTLYRTFTRDHVDPNTGEEIDLRLQPEDIVSDRTVDPMHVQHDPLSVRPKYDPVTGELLRPLDVAGDSANPSFNSASIPIAQSVVQYASVAAGQNFPGLLKLSLNLLTPANVTVMFFVAIPYLVGHFLLVTVVLFFMDLPIAALLLSHYGNVIDDTGPELNDELPRPLRHLEFSDDLVKPFFAMFASVVICYSPAISIAVQRLPLAMVALLAIAGSFVLPAVMLTMTTSGSIFNMRPDRVFKLISITGSRYFVAVALWLVALTLHLWTWLGVVILEDGIRHQMISHKWLPIAQPIAFYPLIAIAIYLMHLYCWYLGILYRRHHHEFPWVLQRHTPGSSQTGFSRHHPAFGVVRPAKSASAHRPISQS